MAVLLSLPVGLLSVRYPNRFSKFLSRLSQVGYAIPGYALCAILVVYTAARWGWFPMGGFRSIDYDDLSFFGKIGDLAHHAALPLICYTIGSFAFVTLLLKNQLMDNLAADFVRTAVAKGVSFRQAVFRHALRNSLIPLATYFGQSVSVLVGGSAWFATSSRRG